MNKHFSLELDGSLLQSKNQLRVVGSDVYMTLTKGQETVFSLQDIHRVAEERWYVVNPRPGIYYARCERYGHLHEFLMGGEKGVDHIDRDGLNNRTSNLRVATRSQQQANTGIYKNNKLGVRGVTQKKSGRFQARVHKDGTFHSAGTHDTVEQAAHAYDRKALELYGPNAGLNYPQEQLQLAA